MPNPTPAALAAATDLSARLLYAVVGSGPGNGPIEAMIRAGIPDDEMLAYLKVLNETAALYADVRDTPEGERRVAECIRESFANMAAHAVRRTILHLIHEGA